MGKPQLPAGELGKIDVKRLTSGRYRARASTRGDGGVFHRLASPRRTRRRSSREPRYNVRPWPSQPGFRRSRTVKHYRPGRRARAIEGLVSSSVS